jgi:hypothetical protein
LSSDNPGNTDATSGYDPESLRSSHTTFLSDLLDGLFLSPDNEDLSRLLKQILLQVDATVDIIDHGSDIDQVRVRGIKAIVDECVRELENVGERSRQGRVEKLLLTLDGGQWFTDNLHNGDGDSK